MGRDSLACAPLPGSRAWEEVPTLSNQLHPYSTFLTDKGRAPARSAVDCPITTSGAAPLIVDGFRRVRRSTFTEGAIMERAEYKTTNGGSRRATPDAPERIGHPRRCTGHGRRTPDGGSARERVPTAPHVRKRVETCNAGRAGAHWPSKALHGTRPSDA